MGVEGKGVGVGVLVEFFNIYFFKKKEKYKRNAVSFCFLLCLGCEYIFVIFCGFLFESFFNKKFKRIFFSIVFKEFLGFWGYKRGSC